MEWMSVLPLLLAGVCASTSCTWMDHPTSTALQRDLVEASKTGLGLAMFFKPNDPDLTVRSFNGADLTIRLKCCPPIQGRSISRNRIVMVDMTAAPTINPLRDMRGFVAGVEKYGGPVVELDSKGNLLARSLAYFRPATISLSPDGEHFALVSKPLEHADWPVGVYVGGFHEKEARRLSDVQVPNRYQGAEDEPSLDWSPNGDMVLFSHLGTISLIDVDSGHSRKIANGGAARWAPRGDWISYLTLKSEAALLNVSSGQFRVIDPGKEIGSPVEWSPDGKYLLIAEQQGSHVHEGCLWVYRVSDGAWVPLPDYGAWLKRWYWIKLSDVSSSPG